MKLQPAILELPAREGVRAVALALLAKTRKAADRLSAEPDADALHDFRVALRRLRSWLRAFKPELQSSVRKKDRRALRDVAHATNFGRDIDVQLTLLRGASEELGVKQRKGADWLDAHLTKRQRSAGDPVDAALLRQFDQVASRLEDKLGSFKQRVRSGKTKPPETLADAVAALLPDAAADLGATLGKVRSAKDDTQAHKARIAAKRLRYVLEPVAPFAQKGDRMVSALRTLQDNLGAIHDAHVVEHEIGAALEDSKSPVSAHEGLAAVAEHVRDDAERAYTKMARRWRRGQTPKFRRDVSTFAKRLCRVKGR